MRKKIVSTHLLDLKDTHSVFWVRNTENEYNFCLFPQGDLKVKRKASA